jgi:hypothetical protein
MSLGLVCTVWLTLELPVLLQDHQVGRASTIVSRWRRDPDRPPRDGEFQRLRSHGPRERIPSAATRPIAEATVHRRTR